MSFSPGVSDGGPGPSAPPASEDSALAAAPGAPQMPLVVMDVLSLGLLLLHLPSQAPDHPRWGCWCCGCAVPRGPVGSMCPAARAHPHSAEGTVPLPPLLTRVLRRSRNLTCPSDGFVMRIVTAQQGHVTNEHIQRAECLQSLIESVHNWELTCVGNTPCTDEDLPFKNSSAAPGGSGRAAAVP